MTPPDIAKLREALEPFANIDDLQISELEYQCGKGCVARAREALALLPADAEVESNRDEPSYAAGFANCWAAFDEHLNRELAARVPHVVDTVMRMVSARSTPHHISSTPPASQPADVEVET